MWDEPLDSATTLKRRDHWMRFLRSLKSQGPRHRSLPSSHKFLSNLIMFVGALCHPDLPNTNAKSSQVTTNCNFSR